jgi:endonuclease/exonuclease/phosphatase family metal-dependent hydrolase
MMFYRSFLFFLLGVISLPDTKAQDPVYYCGFESSSVTEIKNITQKEEAVYVTDLQEPQFSLGIKGKALDLSDDAIIRTPLKIINGKKYTYNKKSSFSFQIWIRTKPGAIMGTPIAGNQIAEKPDSSGWMIGTHENGAWYLNLSDGKTRFNYNPMASRQKINDGQWHQITISMNYEKQEIWMYFDGKNVAIYNINGLKNTNSTTELVIGGADEKWEYGSYGQWNSFNGYIDEVKIWDRPLSPDEVMADYETMTGEIIMSEIPDPIQIKVMAWNIWHGGHRYGHSVGLQRVIEIIKSSNADIVGLIETYGSGEEIADSLGYYFYLISSNLSIMSRYPIIETIKAFRSFNFGGVRIQLGQKKELIFFNTWLHYLPDYSKSIEEGKSVKELIKAEGETRHAEIQAILKETAPWISNTENIPVIMSGDFNSGSHLDWTEKTKDIHQGYIIEWPVSKEMVKSGFKDSFREMHIDPLIDPGLTWTPRAATSSDKYGLRDRIDYIYYRGDQLVPIASMVVDYHPIMFPSDHAAVVTIFKMK